ncbi:tetratricopeptide repeat domain protein [Synechococcus sp. PCC 7335]|uniref:tetratricopeptide repeat protein n=1 Tax=Synechococcus sp. (strain ATCC 29403 / PCC 7335) TaxID=91464 RepID=UPI00017EC0C3|nr:tetratricopeptide repeat protein [Synechococcus sp. PCC 7335]EDX82694.1 tetratricopeptide repeat domain protein [Synechococcus sp. PCC 7335]
MSANQAWNTVQTELSNYLNFLGFYYCERKKHLEAIEFYDRAIKINPRCSMAYLSRGYNKAELDLYDEAIKDLQIAEQLYNEQGDKVNSQYAQEILMLIKSGVFCTTPRKGIVQIEIVETHSCAGHI